jgi:hypothetical protein
VSVLQGNGDGTFQPAVDFWAGDAPTGVAVGQFDADGQLDVVTARLRTDQLSLLVNDSPHPGDGVVITRDIAYGSPTDPANDPFAAHHTLDVYTPPKGTVSFAGKGKPYPVVFVAHGGGGVTGDKTMFTYWVRTLVVEGIVAVSTNYRLGYVGSGVEPQQAADVAQAFRWTRDNIGLREYGGDPKNMFVFGHSAGATAAKSLATDATYAAEQQHVRGLVLAGHNQAQPGNAMTLPPSLMLNGDEGLERATMPNSITFSEASKQRGFESQRVIVPGRDHLTLVADIALDGDPARVALLTFMREHGA